MKKTGLVVVVILLVLGGAMSIRAMQHTPDASARVERVNVAVDADIAARHLGEAIRFRTVSYQNEADMAVDQFEGFIAWVKRTYPEVQAAMTLTMAGQYTLLYRWEGSDPTLAPILVTGHYDVVPVIPGTEARWSQPPFAGNVSNGMIYGRGALDDKSAVVAQLEAATVLLRDGYRPARTVYFSFGHDEEVSGTRGAAAVVDILRGQGVQLAWTLDEGSFLFDGMFPGVTTLLAPINVAEKGYLTLDIVASSEGGHSSMPPVHTAAGHLAQAISALEDNPVPGGLDGLSGAMFDTASRYMDFGYRLAFANRWAFGSVLENQLSRVPFGNAMLRTTTATTMLSGSVKENVLPIEAVATVNFRLHPRDSVEDIVSYVKGLVENEHVKVRPKEGGNAASPVSDWQGPGYASIGQAVREVYGDVGVMPGIMVAASDSRHYGQIADDAYRFNPMVVTQEDMTGFHGTDEKLAVDTLAQGVRTYVRILRHGGGNGVGQE